MKAETRNLKIKPEPDFNRLLKVLRREGEPDRVPFYELFSNIIPQTLQRIGKESDPKVLPRRGFAYNYSLGYDYVTLTATDFSFPLKSKSHTGQTKEGDRNYLQGEDCTITSWKDFKKYPWPKMESIDYSDFERLPETLPHEGMKCIASFTGILENTMWLLGYEGISLLLYDDDELVKAIFDAVGSRIMEYFKTCASFEGVAH